MKEAPRDSTQAAGRPEGAVSHQGVPERDLRHEVKFVAPPTQRASLEAWLLGHEGSVAGVPVRNTSDPQLLLDLTSEDDAS